MAINNVSVQYNGGFLPDILLLTQDYYLRETHFKCYKRGFVFVAYETKKIYTYCSGKSGDGSICCKCTPPGLPLPGWAEIRQWAYNTQRPLYKDGDTSPILVMTGSLGLIDRSYRDREIGVSPVGPNLAAAWG